MNQLKAAKRTATESIANARERFGINTERAQRVIQEVMETADKAETRLRAAEIWLAYALGRPAANVTNVNVTVNNAAAQLDALRALTGQVVPTIDHNPLETIGNLDQSPKELVKAAPQNDLSALTSAVSADAPATPPASPRAGSTL